MVTDAKTSSKTTGESSAPQQSASLSQLERYLLTSRDYDPVLAATLLHEHGEDDLAVVAGSARGETGGGAVAVLPKVLRVLAESAWPPRLGPRAVEAVCADETGAAAAREMIHAGGGTLFAALEPCLQLRVLLSDRSIVFGGAGARESLAREEEERAAVAAAAVEEVTAVAARPVAAGAVAGVFTHLGPIVSALSAEELNRLISRLAQWCKDDPGVVLPAVAAAAAAAGRDPGEETEGVSAATAEVSVHGDDITSPSPAALEAVEVLVQALCELGGRTPPPGERHRRAWSHAGCIIDDDTPASQERGGGGGGALAPPPVDFAKLTASLCGVISGEGTAAFSHGEDDDGDDAGGLPTAARRHLLRLLPVVRGWHDPVGALLRLKEAGCWAAVALQLELSGNGREAASATLHGVVALLQASWIFGGCFCVFSADE